MPSVDLRNKKSEAVSDKPAILERLRIKKIKKTYSNTQADK
jgi:hypothetical protein